MRAILFDDRAETLAPLIDLRASFDVRVGGLTTLARLRALLGLTIEALATKPEIAALVRDEHDLPVNTLPRGDGPVTLINGRCPIPPAELSGLTPGRSLIEQSSGDVIAARVDHDAASRFLASGFEPGSLETEPLVLDQPVLLSRPWHARSVRDQAIAADLGLLAERGSMRELRDVGVPAGVHLVGGSPVLVAEGVSIMPGVVLVAEDGPIALCADAVLRPGAVVSGPTIVGSGTTILDHAAIRPATAIGPRCKVGGEVGGTVFQGLSNKAHEGYLGDAWVGQWVNLGAGTTTSNLLNTYSEVIATHTPGATRERTGETFLGPIIADHVKTAIGTRIMTGAVLHTGSMFARTAPVAGTVDRFTWSTDAGDRPYRVSKFLEVARAAMGRRDVEPSPAYLARLAALAEHRSGGRRVS